MPDHAYGIAHHAAHLIPDDDQERDMQRGRLIKGFVEAAKHIEHKTRKTSRCRFYESCGQRKSDEAENSDDLCRQIALCQPVDLFGAVIDEQRNRIKQIDRPIGNDAPRDKRNLAFPSESKVRHMTLLRCEPVGRTVGQVEKGGEKQKPKDRATDHRPPRRSVKLRQMHFHAWPSPTRSAIETVKMPH